MERSPIIEGFGVQSAVTDTSIMSNGSNEPFRTVFKLVHRALWTQNPSIVVKRAENLSWISYSTVAAYISSNMSIDRQLSSCIRSFCCRHVLGPRSLKSLVIPGTHNSGSYSLEDQENLVNLMVVCQDEDILSQLLYGNRSGNGFYQGLKREG